jgi:hypothetical protein
LDFKPSSSELANVAASTSRNMPIDTRRAPVCAISAAGSDDFCGTYRPAA